MIDTDLSDLVRSLDGVRQDPRWHPEGDALIHTLQVFEHARRETDDPHLRAAALLHDVGKAVAGADHDTAGAELLDGLVHPYVVWLVRHHLDLLRAPGATRRRLRHDPRLIDLERLRRYDMAGRVPDAPTMNLDDALTLALSPALVRDAGYVHPFHPHEESEDANP